MTMSLLILLREDHLSQLDRLKLVRRDWRKRQVLIVKFKHRSDFLTMSFLKARSRSIRPQNKDHKTIADTIDICKNKL